MTEKVYSDFDCLTNDMIELFEDANDVVCIADYDVAKNVVTDLIRKGYDPIHIDLSPNYYEDEYLISISDDLDLICEPAIVDDEVVPFYGDVVFIHGDAKMKILDGLDAENPNVIAFEMEWEYDPSCDCDDCEYADECSEYEDESDDYIVVDTITAFADENDAIAGFEYYDGVSRYSYYSSDEEDVMDALKEFIDFLNV